MVLIALGCAWIAGIALGSIVNVPLPAAGIGLVPVLLLPFFRRYGKPLVLTGLCIAAFVTGAWYYGANLPSCDSSTLRYYNDRGTVEITGMVVRDPEQRETNTRLHLEAASVCLDGEWRELTGTALVFVPRDAGFRYGDTLLLRGDLRTPPQLDDFDYEHYLAVKGIYSTLYYPSIEVLETGKGSKLLAWIYSARNSLSRVTVRIMPEPQASIIRGIVLGMRGDIPPETKEAFSRSGTAHLLAISGLHLSIIAGVMITVITRRFGRRRYLYVWLTLVAVWLYALITGLNPPVLRAAIMVSMYLAADLFGRQRSGINALVLAAAVMAAFTPRVLWDASFQMSFAAMTGLVFIFPLLQSFSRKVIDARLKDRKIAASLAVTVTDSLSVSTGAVVAVWPLIAYYFGAVSPLAPVATLFALPALPVAVIAGIISGATGLFFLPLAQVCAWFGWLFTSWILLVVNLFSFIPAIEGVTIGVTPVVIYYAVLVSAVWYFHRKYHNQGAITPPGGILSMVPARRFVIPLLLAAVAVSVFAFSLPDGKLHAGFLDVGQGDAILIRKGSRQILIDGGPSPQLIAVELGKSMPFWDRTIDLIVMTHPDADHCTGLLEVLERYHVKTVLYPVVKSNSSLYRQFLALLEEKAVEGVPAEAGQRIVLAEGIVLDVLNPVAGFSSKYADDDSVVLRMEAGDISFLFTGDISAEAEYRLMAERAFERTTVLKVAHHGSSTSTSAGFLHVVEPRIAVISAGEDNRYGHPSEEVLERLEALDDILIFRTDTDGTVEIITDGAEVRIITDK